MLESKDELIAKLRKYTPKVATFSLLHRWEIGQLLQKLCAETSVGDSSTIAYSLFNFSYHKNLEHRTLYEKITKASLREVIAYALQKNYDLQWSVVRNALQACGTRPFKQLLIYAIDQRLSGLGVRRYAAKFGYSGKRDDTERTAVLRATENLCKDLQTLRSLLPHRLQDISGIQEEITDTEKYMGAQVHEVLDTLPSVIGGIRETLYEYSI